MLVLHNTAIGSSLRLLSIGMYFVTKYRRRAAESGFFTTAVAMRKQGVPLEVARLVLLGRLS